jgi:hypothetical protein
MLFGPSDSFGFPIFLFACNSHGFDSCLNALGINKCPLQNKCFYQNGLVNQPDLYRSIVGLKARVEPPLGRALTT